MNRTDAISMIRSALTAYKPICRAFMSNAPVRPTFEEWENAFQSLDKAEFALGVLATDSNVLPELPFAKDLELWQVGQNWQARFSYANCHNDLPSLKTEIGFGVTPRSAVRDAIAKITAGKDGGG